MHRFGIKPGKYYSAEQVRAIRRQMPNDLRSEFLLKGEMSAGETLSETAAISRRLRATVDSRGQSATRSKVFWISASKLR
jgi:hypothetical protein